jgi:hypothetical protein
MKELLIYQHLGLGDHLICNAAVRHLCKEHEVTLLTKPHNATTIAFMFRDLSNLNIVDVDDDAQAQAACSHVRKHGKSWLGLGMWGDKAKYNHQRWDESIYNQLNMDFKDRWNGFKCARQESRELEIPKGKYCFVHDDFQRGITIPPEALPLKRMKIVRPDKSIKNAQGEPCILFDYWGWLDGAEEIHCVDSSFAILADHLHLSKFANKKLVLHLGLRDNEYPPARMKDFEIVRHNRYTQSIA